MQIFHFKPRHCIESNLNFQSKPLFLNMNLKLSENSVLSKIKYLIGVVAGKGGVGKSTVSVNLALALKELGFIVGILDADIYGPSLKTMLGVKDPPQSKDGMILPVEVKGIKVMSLSLFKQGVGSSAVRAPIANAIITQFLTDVDWGSLDYLIIDFPPGTGDIQLTLMQKATLSGALLVSTPQKVAIDDVKKAKEMLEKMQVPVLGAIENMSYYRNAYGEVESLFGKSFLPALELPVLAYIGLEPPLSRCMDEGLSIFEEEDAGEAALSFLDLASRVGAKMDLKPLPILELINSERFSLTFYGNLRYDFNAKDLQSRCPCIRCQEKPKEGSGEIKEISLIGAYALKIKFTSGCSNGIYSFQSLSNYATAAVCVQYQTQI
jgi:ATP-binding protein involved in chromosome partitioning